MTMKLYDYFRSSASFRVRIALNLKGFDYEQMPVDLAVAAHADAAYGALNAQHMVPTLVDGADALTQSLAVCEYLDEIHPEPALLPADPRGRAQVRALAQLIACDMHPLNNLRVLAYLRDVLAVDKEARDGWYGHWIATGFTAFEAIVSERAAGSRFCYGDSPTLADVCLVPQVFNARRFECDLEPYPHVLQISDTCLELPAFDRARPERQPGAG